MPKITGTAMWARVFDPDTRYEPCWKIDVVLTDAEAQKLKDVGIKVKRNDDGNYQYKFKRKVTGAKGQANRQPIVVGPDKEPFTQLIGNGSKVCVIYKVYEWKNNFGKGVGADLDKIMVLEHVPYGDGTTQKDEDFDDAPAEKPKAKQEDEDF